VRNLPARWSQKPRFALKKAQRKTSLGRGTGSRKEPAPGSLPQCGPHQGGPAPAASRRWEEIPQGTGGKLPLRPDTCPKWHERERSAWSEGAQSCDACALRPTAASSWPARRKPEAKAEARSTPTYLPCRREKRQS